MSTCKTPWPERGRHRSCDADGHILCRLRLPLRGPDTCRQCMTDPLVAAQLERACRQQAGTPPNATPCPYRGAQLPGEAGWRECKGCQGKQVRVKVFACTMRTAGVTDNECRQCQGIAPVLAITAVYRAIDKTIEHCESVLAGLPDGSTFVVWDDNSPWPDCGRLFQYCVHRGIRYVRADTFGHEGQGHYGFALDWIIRTFGDDHYVFITESDCILPTDWHARYAALIRQAPDNWGEIAGLSVDADGQLEQPDKNRCDRLKLTPKPGLNEVDNCCFAGAIFNPKVWRDVRFNPTWGLLPNTVGIGRMLTNKGWRCFLSPDVPIYHEPSTSRNILRGEGRRHK